MSRSKRAAVAAQVEAIWRLKGPEEARLYADRMLPRGTGIRCPACNGKGGIEPPPGVKLPHGKDDCPLCLTSGALRPRGFGDRRRNEDFAIRDGNRP